MQAVRRLNNVVGALARGSHARMLSNEVKGSSFYSEVKVAPPDAIFLTAQRFKADTDPRKIDLGVGAYRTDEGKPLVLNVVRKAEQLVLADTKLNKEYLPIDGEPGFVKAARELLFGADHPVLKQNRAATIQTLSGTGALRIAAEFIKTVMPTTTVFVSNPTWGNHNAIFARANLPCKFYKYWDAKNRRLDLTGMLADLRSAPNGSVIVLHACAHNPTGVDPTQDEWKQIAAVMKEKGHLAFFDSAYQGFASGDLHADAWSIRYFAANGFNPIVCQSFAKNFGLYNERIGSMTVVADNDKEAAAVLSQLKILVRTTYSNPPAHGAHIVRTILSDPKLFAEWDAELKGMANRIKDMRALLVAELKKLGTPGDWSHIITQIGMFSFTGLSVPQCKTLTDKHHVYLLESGRISMAGINSKNVQYLAKCIDEVVRQFPSA